MPTIQTAIHRRNRVFTFRLRVPAPLVALIGRQYLRRSLRTTDPVQARLRGARLLRAAREMFRALGQQAAMLTREEIEEMIRGFYAVKLEEWSLYRYADPPDDADVQRRLGAEDELRDDFDRCSDHLAAGEWWFADPDFQQFQKLFGVEIWPDSRDGWLVREYLMRARRQFFKDQIAILNHKYEGDVVDPLFKRPLPDPASVLSRAKQTAASSAAIASSVRPQAPAPASRPDRVPGAGTGEAAAVFAQAVAIAAADGRITQMDPDPEGRLPLVPEVARRQLDAKALRTIPELFPEFLERKAKAERTQKTLDDYKRSLAAFVEIVGLRPVALYRPADVEEFVQILSRVPARHRVKLAADGPYRAAAELNAAAAEKDRLPTMKAGTINHKYLTNLVSFFDWALKREMIAKNPAAGMQIEGPKGAGHKPRRPFTVQELTAIFHIPVYIGCKSERHFMRRGEVQLFDHHRFVPALGLFTGCRLNELGQLRPIDLLQENGRYLLRITTAADPEDPEDADELRRLKTIRAERLVPLHPVLVDTFGFPAYVESVRRAGAKRVFPGWQPSKSDHYYSSVFSKWFNERLLSDHLGIKKSDIVFHSLRHNVKDALRRASVPIEIQNRFLGHAPASVGESYGTPHLLAEEAEWIDRISYPGLDLSHIKPFS